MVLVVDLSVETGFDFGKILDIFIVNNKPFFVCQVLRTIGFCDHVGGWEVVARDDKVSCVFQHNLVDPFPLYDFRICTGERFVVFKYYL